MDFESILILGHGEIFNYFEKSFKGCENVVKFQNNLVKFKHIKMVYSLCGKWLSKRQKLLKNPANQIEQI